jgi:protein ImuB
MRRVVSLFLPHWSTDRLRRKTAKSPPDAAAPTAPLVTAIPDHGRASSRRWTTARARSASYPA